ncbi:MAG: hypothetical protein AAF363_14645 [Bacteroidota bacterium]
MFRTALLLLLLVINVKSIIGQALIFSEPQKLDSGINTEAEEIAPLLSPSGDKLFYVKTFGSKNIGGKFSGSDIWVATKKGPTKWAFPTNDFNGYNTNDNNAIIGVHENGEILYLLNTYNKKGGIAFSKMYNGKWTMPEEISIPGLKTDDFVGFYMNQDYSILLISMRGKDSYGQEDLYVSLKGKDGAWQAPKNLGPTINTEGFEISPFLSEDGLRLYFSSNSHTGYGDADVFVSERKYGVWDVWSTPDNLGPRVNSQKFDAYFSVYDSLYFISSNREGGLSDIYQGEILRQKKLYTLNTLRELLLKSQRDTKLRSFLSEIEASGIVGGIENRTILFEELSYDLNEEDKAKLNLLCARISNKDDLNLKIIALLDVDSSDPNLDLIANWRLLNVANSFIQCGIDIKKIVAEKEKRVLKDEEVNTLKIDLFRLTDE